MGATDLVLAPYRAGRLAVRALEDLNALAERARREPDPVEEVRERIDLLVSELGTLVVLLGEVVGEARALNAVVPVLTATAIDIESGGRELTATAQDLDRVGREILVGGRELTATGKSLDGTAAEIRDGGRDLTEVAKRLDASMRVFRAALPRLMDGLDTVEHLEDAVETVAETVEPLQATAERVGKVTKRLSRSS